MPPDTDSDVSASSASLPSGAEGLGTLRRLPPELRLMIYEFTLRRKKAVLACNDPTWNAYFLLDPMKIVELTEGPALLVASKQIHAEAMPVFFSCNTIKFINDELHQIQNFSHLPYLKHITILFRDTCWLLRSVESRVTEESMGALRQMFSDIQAFSHGATSLETIHVSQPKKISMHILVWYWYSFNHLQGLRQTWLDMLRQFLEEAGVATAEDFLREAFGRDVVWRDEHFAWTLLPFDEICRQICAAAGAESEDSNTGFPVFPLPFKDICRQICAAAGAEWDSNTASPSFPLGSNHTAN